MTNYRRYFRIIDIDTTVIVEVCSRKHVLDWLEDYIENGCDDDSMCEILYKDGTLDRIDTSYDGHKIKKIHIKSILFDNPCSSIVYGHFTMNEYGVCHAAFDTYISNENIREEVCYD